MQTIKILIVDDVEENRMILKKICDGLDDVELLTAENGKIAVEIAREQKPQIVLMDIMMPVMDGFEATRRIRALNDATVIMVVTALNDSETENKIVLSGANAFITKPLDRNVTRFKIQNFIALIKNRRNPFHLTKKAAINPFSNDIRSMKTIYYINNENDLMDFGSWLTDLYARHNESHTFRFDTKLEVLYKLISANLVENTPLSIIIEDGFENLYVTFACEEESIEGPLRPKIGTILDDIIFKDHFIHIRIILFDPRKLAPAKAPAIEEPLDNTPQTEEKIKRKINADEKELLRTSYTEKINAASYVESLGDIVDELHDLIDIENEWRQNLEEFHYEKSAQALRPVSQTITKYASVINSLYDFMALAYSMSTLSLFLENIREEQLDEGKIDKLNLVLSSILGDLENWRETLFVKQEASDIHYLDSSLFSSCLQVETIMSPVDIEQNDEDDIEFF